MKGKSARRVRSGRTTFAILTLGIFLALSGQLISVRASNIHPRPHPSPPRPRVQPSAQARSAAVKLISSLAGENVGYWKFDEAAGLTAADSSPTGNNGTLQGGCTWVTGEIGSALSFDGQTGYVQVGDDLSQWLGGTASLSAWIKTTQFGKGDFFHSPGITGIDSVGDGNDVFWGWIDGSGRIGIQAGNGSSARSLNPINDGQWHHIGLTRDAGTGQVKTYVDGVLNATVISETGEKTTKFYGLGRIGVTEGTPNYFQGQLDEVRIYNVVLSASDIQALAAATAPTNLPPTILQSPTNQLVVPGQPAGFQVSASGTAPLNYQWQRNTLDISTATTDTYTLASPALADDGAQFLCIVANPYGVATSAVATLSVTNDQPPVATITQPTAGSLFSGGDTILFAGTGTDPEDGNLPLSAFTWRVDAYLNNQVSSLVPPTSGITNGSFIIPTTSANSTGLFYRIWLTVKDSLGVMNTTNTDLLPRTATITLQTSPAGLLIKLDGQPTATATSAVGVVGLSHTLEAFSQVSGSTAYAFDHWSDGGAAAQAISFPATDTTYTAFYQTNVVSGQSVGYWRFDEAAGPTAADSSPTANNGTLQGGSTWVAGKINSALSFDGQTGYVRVGSDLSQWLGGTASLSAWIKTTGVGKGDFFHAPGITGVDSVGDGNDVFWGWLDGGGRLAIQAGNGASAQSLNPVNDGQWHHIGLTRDAGSGQVQIYVDGVLNATAISDMGQKTTKFYSLGRIEHTDGTAGYWQGQLDEVSIYNAVLSASDIQTLAGVSPPASQPPMIFQSPTNEAVVAGQPAGFQVTASGTAPLTYQWQRNTLDISGATTNTYAIASTALTNDGDQFECIVANPYGVATSAVATLSVTATPSIPLPPGGVAAFGGDGQVTLTWNPSVGALSYNVWRSTDGSTFGQINTGPVISTTYTNTGLVDGKPYFYEITAVGTGGESGYSQQVRALPSSVPSGFGVAQVLIGLTNPTQMEIAPDGRIFVAQEDGGIRLVKNDVLSPTPVATFSVDSSGERGLLGITVDPNFAADHYLYIYYTAGTNGLPTSHNRVSRLTLNGDVMVPGSEVVLLELPVVGNTEYHMGGAIHFGADGKLYISVGDYENADSSQSLAIPTGKILRINADGSIPTDNPFYNTPGANQAIWVYGLRNPFTSAVQPGTGRIFIDDVGKDAWEEIDEGVAGGNYGWPTTEGAFDQSAYPSFIEPRYAYPHTDGCAITGGTFYNPPTQQFPASYIGKYFFQDFCNGWIRMLNPADNSVITFATFAGSTTFPTDLKVSPDGSLYVLSRASGGGNVQAGLGGLYKIQYLLSSPPVITLPPASQLVTPGQSATFHVSATGTPPLGYQWQRNTLDLSGEIADTYTLSAAALADDGAQFRCIVSNAYGSVTSMVANLTVTNAQPPVATITTPTPGTLYNAGDVINFTGAATDAQDPSVPPSAFTWQVDLIDDIGVRPFVAATNGFTSGSFTMPTSGETAAPDIYFRITLTVTDSIGLTDTTNVDLQPRISNAILTTVPAGLTVNYDGAPQTTPSTNASLVNAIHTIEAPLQQSGAGLSYLFDHWSDGGPAVHSIAFPTLDTTYTAYYQVNTVTDEYVGYWKFDEDTGLTAADSSPTANNGTLQGGVTWVPGKFNSALSFDGQTGYVSVADDLNQWLGGTASLSAWIKTTGVGKGDFFHAPGITGVDSVGDGNDVFWGWLDGGGRLAIQAGNGASAQSLNPVNDGQWHHIGLTRDAGSGQVQIYVDGVLNATATSDMGQKTTKFYGLGRIDHTDGTAAYFQGQLDDVRIYNFILGASDMQTLAGH